MKITSFLVTAGLVAAGVVGYSGTATAVSHICTYNNACLYSDPGFNGHWFDNFNSQPNWGAERYNDANISMWRGDGVATNVSALDNWDPDSTIAVYYNSQYRGPCFTVAAYGSASDFRQVRLSDGTNANERMNSHHFNRSCGPVYNF